MDDDASWHSEGDLGVNSLDEEEIFFECPYCGGEISVLLDLSVRRQTVIEDCEVCCRPIVISYHVGDHAVDELYVRTEDDL